MKLNGFAQDHRATKLISWVFQFDTEVQAPNHCGFVSKNRYCLIFVEVCGRHCWERLPNYYPPFSSKTQSLFVWGWLMINLMNGANPVYWVTDLRWACDHVLANKGDSLGWGVAWERFFSKKVSAVLPYPPFLLWGYDVWSCGSYTAIKRWQSQCAYNGVECTHKELESKTCLRCPMNPATTNTCISS